MTGHVVAVKILNREKVKVRISTRTTRLFCLTAPVHPLTLPAPRPFDRIHTMPSGSGGTLHGVLHGTTLVSETACVAQMYKKISPKI